MKKVLFVSIIISAIILLLPLCTIKNSDKIISASTIKNNTIKVPLTQSTSFRVYNHTNDKISELSAEDYIFGVVAAEMPALYEEEALKAQAVAAYTFACCRKAENADKDYDITTDSLTDQSFVTQEQANERWGEKADEYTNKIRNAVKSTLGYVVTYEDKPITSVYHAISSGKTESSNDIWNVELPYLIPVTSEADKLATNYMTEAVFTEDEIKEKLKSVVELSGEPSEYFGSCIRTDSGAVKSISVCKKNLTGSQIRELLELRSSNFTVNFADGKFTFTVYGYGHGVGMSQNGANSMAKTGSSFDEILKHYYTGCEIQKIKDGV